MPGSASAVPAIPLKSHMPTVPEWVAQVRGKPADPDNGLVEFKLRHYHMRKGTDIEGRKELLNGLKTIGKTFTAKHNATHPLFGPYFNLSSCAYKQLQSMDKASGSWGKARRIFAPSAHGSHVTETHHLVHRGAKAPTPTSEGNYWLEALDPKHRSWGHHDKTIFERWVADASTTLNFFDWCEEKNLAQGEHSVRYLDPKERWKFMIVFGDDKIAYRHVPSPVDARGKGTIPLERFTTWGRSTAFSGDNFAIWVCSPGGVFYSDSHAVGEFHHSTFLAGGRVMGAGEWVVTAGKVLLVSHKTGHYQCSVPMFYNTLRHLSLRADLSRTVVEVADFVSKSYKYYTCTEFLANAGNPALCHEIRDYQTGLIMDMKAEAARRCEMHRDWDMNFATSHRNIGAAAGALRTIPVSRPPTAPPL